MSQSVKSLLLATLARWPENHALCINGREITYDQFLSPVIEMNASLQALFTKQAVIGVLADKTLHGYQCIASAFLTGNTYVPLNANYPLTRNAGIVEQSCVRLLLVDSVCKEIGKQLQAYLNGKIGLVIINSNEEDTLDYEYVQGDESYQQSAIAQPVTEDTAYILFTSGSTGKPKGVPISNQNLATYLSHITQQYDFRSDDRFSQFFDFTFDLSLHDMLVCWQSGGCLCAPGKTGQLMPLQFAAKTQLTVWFSVPSLALTAKDLMRDKFAKFRLETLRMSFFCGEALPQTLANEWSQITRQAPVINLYGPTEATIAFTAHQYAEEDAGYPVVPIGRPLVKNSTTILDSLGKPCERGELCLGGDQVFSGYWQADELSQSSFQRVGESSVDGVDRWYRTGDIVSTDANGTLLYHGRNDRQVQVNGFRVELQEVEHALRELIDSGTLAVIAYPHNAIGEPIGLTGFVSSDLDNADLLELCKSRLPSYMIPKQILTLDEFPYNSSGKLDYKRLTQIAVDADG